MPYIRTRSGWLHLAVVLDLFLFAHADRRHQKDGSVSPPGLWRLSRHCEQGGLLQTAAPGVTQDVVLFASVPLTDEDWQPMASGQILVARQGQLISS